MAEEIKGGVFGNSEGGTAAAHPPAEVLNEALVGPSTTGEINTIRLSISPIACWTLGDNRFEFDSSFVKPALAEEIGCLNLIRKRFEDALASVFGHADPVGDDEYNKILSGRRSACIYALLTRRADIWEDIYSNKGIFTKRSQTDKWDVKSVQVMLDTVGSPPGRTDGELDDPTKDAIGDFQGKNGLSPHIAAGKDPTDAPTREKLFLAFMDKICGKDFLLQKEDFLALGADKFGKGDYQGCSEFNPVLMFSKEENERLSKAENREERDTENSPNRRVVVYLFHASNRVKNLKNWPCPKVNEGTAACRSRFFSDQAKRRQFQEKKREYQQDKDTFACRFYDRLAHGSPCEAGIEQSTPTFFTVEQPGASNTVRMHSLHAYVALYHCGANKPESVVRGIFKEGKLFTPPGTAPIPLDCDRETFFYFSHRDDLDALDHAKFWLRDKTGLPLLGPFVVPCGPDAKVELNIWDQKDWAIVRGKLVDGVRPDKVKMTQARDDYSIGQLLPFADGSGIGFFPHGDEHEKMKQEVWKGGAPIDLIQFGSPGGNPMFVGTLSALPSPKAKLLLAHFLKGELFFCGSYNEIAPTGDNQDFPGHHLFDQALVNILLAVPRSGQPRAVVDALPLPPARVLLPGDICWADQEQTNNCGAFSFAAAMNYWLPYDNNPQAKDGKLYAKPGNVDDLIKGARTPANIVDAAGKFRMNGRDNDGEDLDQERALKLLKLWLLAGVPVLILVEEEYNLWSLHWKTVVGYDATRYYMNNSGADNEVVRAKRTPGIDYEHAPVGNDVDSHPAFFKKWREAGGNVVDLITSVDRCTFIPLFPKDTEFAGTAPK